MDTLAVAYFSLKTQENNELSLYRITALGEYCNPQNKLLRPVSS